MENEKMGKYNEIKMKAITTAIKTKMAGSTTAIRVPKRKVVSSS
jgi:hypothetical protein